KQRRVRYARKHCGCTGTWCWWKNSQSTNGKPAKISGTDGKKRYGFCSWSCRNGKNIHRSGISRKSPERKTGKTYYPDPPGGGSGRKFRIFTRRYEGEIRPVY